jgi:hypothetical protein
VLVVTASCTSASADTLRESQTAPMPPPATDAAPFEGPPPALGLPEVAMTNAAGEVAVVRDGAIERFDGLVAPQAPVAVRLTGDDATTLEWVELATGAVTASRRVEPGLQIAATDPAGHLVALVTRPTGHTEGAIAPSRTTSVVVVVDDAGMEHRVELAGNYVPEAFANFFDPETPTLPGGVFLLEYLPPEAPSHYRVRVLDTTTDQLTVPLNLRDKTQQLDEQMAGVSRTQVVAERDGLLFTLYRGENPDGSTYAFVHTLGFANGVWCLVVPDEMSLATEPGAIAADDGTRSLLVASANGSVGRFDIARVLDPAQEPTMSTVVAIAGAGGAVVPAITAGADHVWVAHGGRITGLDPLTLDVRTELTWDRPIASIDELAGGALLIAGAQRIAMLDPVSGALLDEMELSGEDEFGDVTRMIPLG